jgi:hypothetical protein
MTAQFDLFPIGLGRVIWSRCRRPSHSPRPSPDFLQPLFRVFSSDVAVDRNDLRILVGLVSSGGGSTERFFCCR